MDARVKLIDGMHFEASASSGHTVALDSSEAVGGRNLGFRPTELIAMGTAGCTSMDVISILRKKKVDLRDFEVRVHVESQTDGHPKVFTSMHFEYVVTGKDIVRADVERAVELSETKYCQGIAMMRKTAEISSEITIIEV